MELILLEKIGKLGDLGAVVKVRGGHARNYLVPQGKALPATPGNLAQFEARRAAIEQRQLEIKETATALAGKVGAMTVQLSRPAGSSEKLFGSVTNADIADYFQTQGVDISRKVIDVVTPIRTLGTHKVVLRLHPDVSPEVTVVVQRSVK